ncbi:MAG: PcfJ domain-containing protein [Oscillospiraceae bacterium]|nr:PcfJ domain-containing protein [Oscillospiraceae bacterium]
MRKERKEALLHSFPAVPAAFMEQMKGRGAKNYVVLLTNGNELFARCFHRYYHGELIERQRYVFAVKEGCCRYGYEEVEGWSIRKEFREPLFCSKSYGYDFDNSYTILNIAAISKSCMKYSLADQCGIGTDLLMEYLRIYYNHPNIEYVKKAGYQPLIETYRGYWGGLRSLQLDPNIDWKQNSVLKMLRLNREEFRLLKGREHLHEKYCFWRDEFPKFSPDELIALAESIGYDMQNFAKTCKLIDKTPQRLAKYLADQGVGALIDYADYINQCAELDYNLHDTAVCFPHDFREMHTRLSALIKYQHDQEALAEFAKRKPEREFLNFRSGDYLIRQPDSMDEIAIEGKMMKHCVGGYAERHAHGRLHILFIRKTDEPDKPYATLELTTYGSVVQCRCRCNADPPQEVKDFVNEWLAHIRPYFEKKERKSA